MIQIRSISHPKNPINSLVSKALPKNLPEGTTEYRFHLVDQGEHRLTIATIQIENYGDDMDESGEDISFDTRTISYEEVKAAADAPATKAIFARSLLALPKIEMTPPSRSGFQIKGLDVHLSREMRMGIEGDRSTDHEVSVEHLQQAIAKKRNALKHQNRTEFFFLVDQKKLLKLVVRYQPGKPNTVTILTAFFPTQSYTLAGFASKSQYEAWKGRLPTLSSMKST